MKEALQSLCTDEELCDIVLQGTDGVRVPATRIMLAARSPVFRNMLLSDFRESHQTEIEIGGYTGEVLKLLVEYICTDEFNPKMAVSAAYARKIISVMDAAEFFHLRTFRKKVMDWILETMKDLPHLSAVILDECKCSFPESSDIFGDLEEAAMTIIRSDPSSFLDQKSGSHTLSPSTLEIIVKDSKIKATEYELFSLIQRWAKGTKELQSAKDLVKFIRLERIDPEVLSGKVADSGLVSDQLQLAAFRNQALYGKAHCFENAMYDLPRMNHEPAWHKDGSPVFSYGAISRKLKLCKSNIFEMNPISNGVHKWSLRTGYSFTGRTQFNCLVGIVPANQKLDYSKSLSCQEHEHFHCWTHKHTDTSTRNGVYAHSRTVKLNLTLDLTPESGGTLSVETDVNGDMTSTSTVVASNLLQHVNKQQNGNNMNTGFLPAATLYQPGAITIQSFEAL